MIDPYLRSADSETAAASAGREPITLSIVITCLNDVDLQNTVKSIQATAGARPEIIIVSDGTFIPACDLGDVKIIRNERRIGVGPSRHVGMIHAAGKYVMVCDSHMRFKANWYEQTVSRIRGRETSLTCFACLGLDRDHMDPDNPKSVYYGATWNVFGRDPNEPSNKQIMEAVWNKSAPEFPDAQIPCVMGGAYVASREWFLKISGLNLLRQWGEDETVLSLRSWMFGGDVRIMANIGIGHKFMVAGEKQPFEVRKGYTLHNKLLMMQTLLPRELREFLMEKLQLVRGGGELSTAKAILEDNWHLIEVERAWIEKYACRDFKWVMDRFNIPLPV